MVRGWFAVLDEFEAVLAGKALVPFWRGDNPRLGVNLRRVLTEPRAFDLVMWVRGSAAAPYLEEGRVSSAETWRRLTRVFQGEFSALGTRPSVLGTHSLYRNSDSHVERG
jgi:hypothetical protein